ncbi:multiple cyclophane-containing RiPP AmcA [Streptomyces sp. NPDC059743]|uniref:multiple cyclophane-containing RiPP AmcA n=1 Tax=Streptomyces sp. NPDC059743 TaxID=3346928 RepID=UPI00364AA606
MTILELLAASDAPVVAELIFNRWAPQPENVDRAWDNRPTWDNWPKSPARFDNRPTWDNWNKKK